MLEDRYSYKGIWRMAYPVIIGSAAQDLLLLADTAFLGHLGIVPLGAAAIGGLFYLAIVMAIWGFGTGIQVIIARRYGEGDHFAVQQTFYHALVALIGAAFLLFLVCNFFSSYLLSRFITSEAIAAQSQIFIKTRIWGFFAAFSNIAFRAYFIGTGNTRVISITTLLMTVVNCIFGYLLIFGIGPFPMLAIRGSAIASVIAEYVALCVFVFFAFARKQEVQLFFTLSIQWSSKLFKSIFRTSGPLFFQSALSFVGWFVFFLFVEKMGEIPLAVSNIVRSIYVFLLMPIMGIAATANSLTSFAIGKHEKVIIPKVVQKSIILAWAGISIITIPVYLFPESVIALYGPSIELMAATMPVLFMVMGITYFIAFGLILFYVLSGTGRTKVSLLIEFIVITIYISATYFLTQKGASIELVWIVEGFYGLGLGGFSLLYFFKYGLNEKEI
jgi:putative MATE family efflux protein